MAETAVNLVIDKLVPLLVQKVKLLKGVRRDIAEIKKDLEFMRSFLKDADAKAETDSNEGLKTWVRQIREASYDIEDVVDIYMLHMAEGRHQRGIIGFVHNATGSIKKSKRGNEIASKIRKIKASVGEISSRSSSFGYNDSWKESTSRADLTQPGPRMASLFIREDELVGIDSPRDELISLLEQGKSKRTVITVVGTGGIGKTTLVRNLYNRLMVTEHFDSHAWINVSQSQGMKELLKKLLEKFYEERKESAPQGIDKMEGMVLIEKLGDYLLQKRYVVVFDDVWNPKFWKDVKYAFPENNNGSRIIITTRNKDVGSISKESPSDLVHELLPWPYDRAWELFRKKAFQPKFGDCCPQELEKLSHEFVRRCAGLPLAIDAIGALLSTKGDDVSEWQKLLNSFGSEFESDPLLEDIPKILSRSYHDLPFQLKPCFLYFGMYPENYSIRSTRLIRQWIAEGFIEKKENKTLEEVAEDYLTKLIHRCLVQVSMVDLDGKVSYCRVHSLMHKIIVSRLKQLNFCEVVAVEDFEFYEKTRRLSIHRSMTDDALKSIDYFPVRSVFYFVVDKFPESLMATFIANFKLLKVLDFHDAAHLVCLPEDVGNLFHLRYLSLRRTKIKMLPKSICKLHNLQTLDLKYTLVLELPKITTLRNLRHLLAYYGGKSDFNFNSYQAVKIQEGIGSLAALQKLYYVEANHADSKCFNFTELSNLRQLRKLGIQKLKKEQGEALCTFIEKMDHLESLKLHSVSADEILDIQHISSPPQSLRRLLLQGRLAKFPNWIDQLENLVQVCFYSTGLKNDPLKVFQSLPLLLELRLRHAYNGERLNFEKGGFKKLKVLCLEDMNRLKNVIIEEGALPLLGELVIGRCPKLEMVPSGIQHMRNLTTLVFYDMPKDIVLQIHPDGGKHYWIVKNIPVVLYKHIPTVFYRREGGEFKANTF